MTWAPLTPAPAAHAAPSPDHELSATQLPRPEREREDKERDFDANGVLVRFTSGAAGAAKDRVLSRRDVRASTAVRGTRWVKVHGEGSAVELMRSLRKDPAVASVSLDYERRVAVTPNDPLYSDGHQPYLNTVRLPQAWGVTKGSTSQVIAVVDTGVSVTHPDLKGRTVTGYNAISPGSAPADGNGHGTMVAGIAAANTGNGVGVAGAAWTARVMPVKVLGANGSGYDSDIAEGVIWAADHGAKIINMSLGGPDDGPVLHDAITYATAKGAVVVVAAGNDGDGRLQYPAAYPEVVAVAATDAAGKLTDFSSYGDWIDVAAPGAEIVSTGPDGLYYIGGGTSYSAPIVSGTAALMRAKYPSLTPAQVLSRLQKSARDAGPRGIDPYYGHGILDAYAALGGAWAAEFAAPSLGANEPNDVPARATALGTSATGTIGAEGDVDWYTFSVSSGKAVDVTVTPATYDEDWWQNLDAVVAVYDSDLRLVGEADAQEAGDPEKVSARLAAGTYYVSVSNDNGARDTRAYAVKVTTGQLPMFAPAQATSTGTSSLAVVIGDVTGDGRNDVVMSSRSDFGEADDYKLFVFPQGHDGTLGSPVEYATALQWGDQGGLALFDADADGRQDVALATKLGVEVYRQSDAGALESWGPIAGTDGSETVASEDFDGDGDDDLVTSADGGIKLLTQEGDHTFTVSSVTSEGSRELEIGDVDGDGTADVVGFDWRSVRVWHHTDAGWSLTEHATGSVWTTNGIEVADVNSDDKADVVATIGGNWPNSLVAVFRQNATGGLDAARLTSVDEIPEPIEAADVNGDGRTDLVTAQGGWSKLSTLVQTADGSFGARSVSSIPYTTGFGVQGLAVGDISGDQAVDAVLADFHNSGLVVAYNGRTPSPAGEQAWVRDASPADFATSISTTAKPSVAFSRDVDPASVSSSTVRLLHGRTGAAVDADLSVDGHTVTLSPVTPLQDNTPYRIVVGGVTDTAGAVQTDRFSSTFRTKDLAPTSVTGLKAKGALRGASLSWTLPAVTDLDRIVVRANAGSTAPASPSQGIAVYSGAGTSATATGLTAGTTYTFGVWARDKSGKYSPASTVTLPGTGITISSSTTALTYGGTVRLTGKLVRKDTGAALAGVPVELYRTYKGSTPSALVATVTSDTDGAVTYTHKPSKGVAYEWVYRGASGLGGTVSTKRSVSVATIVTGHVSKTTFRLGGTVTLTGSVSPTHARQAVYLQRLVNGSWKNITSKTLSTSSTYTFSVKPTGRGTYYYRVYKPADTDHAGGYSPRQSFKVT